MGPHQMFTCIEWAPIFLFHGKPVQIGPPWFPCKFFGLEGAQSEQFSWYMGRNIFGQHFLALNVPKTDGFKLFQLLDYCIYVQKVKLPRIFGPRRKSGGIFHLPGRPVKRVQERVKIQGSFLCCYLNVSFQLFLHTFPGNIFWVWRQPELVHGTRIKVTFSFWT